MAANDLTTLADVKAWLGRTDTNSDPLLSALITRASRQIYSYLQRPLVLPHSVSEMQGGAQGRISLLKEWPVLSISSLGVDGVTIPEAAGATGDGWTLEPWDGVPPGRPQRLWLRGYDFSACGGFGSVRIDYQAGYQITNETQTVAGAAATVAAPFGAWACDVGVAYANGTALTKVSGAPTAGQYQPTPNAPGSYTFSAADDGQEVLITYGFAPSDLADACIELVSERYRYAQRIGEKSHSLGGNETVSFDNTRMTPLVVALLQPYRRIAPP